MRYRYSDEDHDPRERKGDPKRDHRFRARENARRADREAKYVIQGRKASR